MRKICSCIFIVFQLLSGGIVAQVEPYLSSPSDTSIWVSWRTDTQKESVVEFGLASEQLVNIAEGECDSLGEGYMWHTVKLSGLTPDTRYYYRTVSGTDTSKIQRFRTQPPVGTDTGHYRFAIIGDHQVIADDRYERTVEACKQKSIEKWATSSSDTLIEDHLRMLVCDGDQVNEGTLVQYKTMHFGQSRPLMSNIPIMTVVGNHEYGSDSELANYFAHYVYDDISYQGITGSRGEEYYAFQVANILFVMVNSNLTNDQDQLDWIDKIVSAADNDSSVEWVFADNHHCYYNEQMPSDGISAVRDEYVPRFSKTDKYAMHITGHAHLYSRGALNDFPCHLIINGGACFDQYWGESESIDYPEIQKTIEREIYQLVDVDLDNREMYVETYSTGTNLTPGFTEDSLIDEYYIKLDAPVPSKPAISNPVSEVTLPYTFAGSEYLGQEPLKSIEFEVAGEDTCFSDPEYSYKTDYEDLYLSSGSPDYTPIDQNEGVDITQMDLDSASFTSGQKFLRFRYRDQSLHWSPWSDTITFNILNGRTVPDNYPLLRYKLDGDAAEAMGSGLDGTIGDAITFVSDEDLGTVACFDNSGMITISSGSTDDLSLPTDAISVSCWVKLNSVDYWGGFVGIFQDNGSDEEGWVLGTYDDSFSFALTTGETMNYLQAGTSINFGEWYHITGTYDGVTQRIYVNGELEGSAAMEGEIIYPSAGWFQIGSYKDDNEDFCHDGYISDVIIWEGTLTSQKVKKLYQGTVAPYVCFNAGETNINAGKYVEFKDMTQFEPQSWQWYFEGGNPESSLEQNPVVYYSEAGKYDVSLVAANAFGTDSVTKVNFIAVGTSTDVESLETGSVGVSLFPNPSSDVLEIRSTGKNISGVKIFDANGNLLKIIENEPEMSITADISFLPEGCYFAHIALNNCSFVIKFIVTND